MLGFASACFVLALGTRIVEEHLAQGCAYRFAVLNPPELRISDVKGKLVLSPVCATLNCRAETNEQGHYLCEHSISLGYGDCNRIVGWMAHRQ